MNRNKEFIPVTITTSLDLPPLWGRILAISPDTIELTSKFEISKGRVLALAFELGGEALQDIRGEVLSVVRDDCGYLSYSIKLSDHAQQKALLEKLLRMLATA